MPAISFGSNFTAFFDQNRKSQSQSHPQVATHEISTLSPNPRILSGRRVSYLDHACRIHRYSPIVLKSGNELSRRELRLRIRRIWAHSCREVSRLSNHQVRHHLWNLPDSALFNWRCFNFLFLSFPWLDLIGEAVPSPSLARLHLQLRDRHRRLVFQGIELAAAPPTIVSTAHRGEKRRRGEEGERSRGR